MAALPTVDRQRAMYQWMRANLEACGFTKADAQAAVDACDTWIDSNQSSFNTALPAAFRINASLTQKTMLFCYVAMRRAGILRAPEDG